MTIRKNNNMESIERHAGTVMQALIIGLLAWTGISLVTIQKDVAILQTEITALKIGINQGTNDRYRGSDAARDFAAVYRELEIRSKASENNTRRIDDLERRLSRIGK